MRITAKEARRLMQGESNDAAPNPELDKVCEQIYQAAKLGRNGIRTSSYDTLPWLEVNGYECITRYGEILVLWDDAEL